MLMGYSEDDLRRRGYTSEQLNKFARHEGQDVNRIAKDHGEFWTRVKAPDGKGGFEVIEPGKPKNELQRAFVEEVRKESRGAPALRRAKPTR